MWIKESLSHNLPLPQLHSTPQETSFMLRYSIVRYATMKGQLRITTLREKYIQCMHFPWTNQCQIITAQPVVSTAAATAARPSSGTTCAGGTRVDETAIERGADCGINVGLMTESPRLGWSHDEGHCYQPASMAAEIFLRLNAAAEETTLRHYILRAELSLPADSISG